MTIENLFITSLFKTFFYHGRQCGVDYFFCHWSMHMKKVLLMRQIRLSFILGWIHFGGHYACVIILKVYL
jgi:hypothetical protein